MHDYLEIMAAAALSNALVATLLGIVAWAASRWVRPTVAHALWLLVFAKLVTPPWLEMPVPLPMAMSFRGADAARESAAIPAVAAAEASATGEHSSAREIHGSGAAGHAAVTGVAAEEVANLPTEDRFGDYTDSHDDIAHTQRPSIARTGDAPRMLDELWTEPPRVDVRPDRAVDASRVLMEPPSEVNLPNGKPVIGGANATHPVTPPGPHVRSHSEVQPAAQVSSANTAVEPFEHKATVGALCAGVWLGGSTAWFLLAAIRILRFRRLLSSATPATPPLQQEVASLAARIGLGRVPDVRIVPSRVSPLVCTPLRRAVLVLPRDLLTRFSAEQRAAVIAHELAHLRRRDHWTRWLEFVALGCYWWLPTVWFARRQLHAAEETCCDAWVVWLLPERARDYARALLETIDFLTPAPEAPLLASGFSRASNLKRRIDMILRQRAAHSLPWWARAGIAAAGLAVLPWSLAVLSADEPPKPPATANGSNPPSTENAPTAGLPSGKAPSTENPPSALPSTQPRATDELPPPTPAAAPPGAPSAAPLPPTAPVPAPPSVGAPPATQSLPSSSRTPPLTTPPSTTAPRASANSADANVVARLERLEATTAELLAIVRQLRDERRATEPARGRYDNPLLGPPDSTDFVVRYGFRDRQLELKVSGPQIAATDVATGKTLWTTTMPWPVSAIQAAQGNLGVAGRGEAEGAIIDPSNGRIQAQAVPTRKGYSTATNAAPATAPAVAATQDPFVSAPGATVASAERERASAERAQQIALVEMEMLDAERKLAQQRADLQHEVRQLGNRRARLLRKLESARGSASADELAKLTAELDDAEDMVAAMQHKADSFETDVEFKIRELQIRRDQQLRAIDGSTAETNIAPQPKRSSAPRPVQR